MNTTTKITLDELMARAEARKNGKKAAKTAELFIPSLDGYITIKAPTREIITQTKEVEDETESDRYLVYACVVEPKLNSDALREAYGVKGEPDRIVDYVFDLGEQSQIAKECLELAGYNNGVKRVGKAELDAVKN